MGYVMKGHVMRVTKWACDERIPSGVCDKGYVMKGTEWTYDEGY